ncbi:MAG: glycosyltransferase [Magnetococcus sp. YQC-3]
MPNTTERSFRDTVFALDASDDLAGLLAFLQNRPHDPNEMLFAMCELLGQDHYLPDGRLRSAFIMAMLLANAGHRHPAISIARAAGGMAFHNLDEAAAGLQTLSAEIDLLSAEEQAPIVHQILYPVLLNLLTPALYREDNTQVLRILELLKGAIPLFRTLFDWEAPVPTLSLADIRHQGRLRSRFVPLSQPPQGALRPRRRVVMAPGQVFVPPDGWINGNGATGERVATAMQAYGWQTELFFLQNGHREETCQELAAFCRQHHPDILIFDDNALIEVPAARATMLQQVRQDTPDIKVVGCLLDAWTIQSHRLLAAVEQLDAIWTVDSPLRPLWNEPAFANKVMHIPFPPVGMRPPPLPPIIPHLVFSGRITGGNWHRAFWLAAAEKRDLPLKKQLTNLDLAGLTPIESYRRYMHGLTEATCAINFVMRPTHVTSVIGRTFEIPWSGSLLVQEATPEMRHYFIPGEHYLEFASLAELTAITRFISQHREEAEAIRQRGHAFACTEYSAEKIVGHIENTLYFQSAEQSQTGERSHEP